MGRATGCGWMLGPMWGGARRRATTDPPSATADTVARRRVARDGRAMSVLVDGARLRLEIARRGWKASALARQAGLSPATVSAALAGRPIAAISMSLIAEALTKAPPIAMIDSLIQSDKPALDLT